MKVYVSMSHGFMALLLVMICLYCTEANVQAMGQQLDVRQYLKRLNKFVVKSIKSPDGDIIDCVHISHQPAFDHPLLKNHTIQMRPSFHPLGLYDENKVALEIDTSSIPQLWHQNGRCPEDTIPIRRMKKDDVLRAERYRKQMHGTIPNPTSAEPNQIDITFREYAAYYIKGGKYYGARATINIWNPKTQIPEEFSTSQFWLLGDDGKEINIIEAGGHVFPSLYRGNKTRLFIFWASDSYFRNGCWNLLCPGFVQVNKEIALGSTLNPISSYGGRQFEIILYIRKDPKTGNWWLQFGDRSPLGYWPSSLLPLLSNGASLVQWGGEVVNNKLNGQHTTTEMGSGHFAEGGFGKASYFRNLQIVNASNSLIPPPWVSTFTTQPSCYDVKISNDGHLLLYGGPGRNPNCK